MFEAKSLFLAGCLALTAGGICLAGDQWVESFYLNKRFCATATIVSVEKMGQNYVVNLDIDTAWAQSMALANSDIKRRWFAIHCPHPMHENWRNQQDGVDILVSGELKASSFQLSCREWQLMQKW